ncbi:MAG: hypothetical protein J6104_04065 [Methanomicrobium sp.]|nr:hypothetical protein [Methanomicrobium sp.]
METIEISKAAYNRIMSKRRGDEAISTVILREIKKGNNKADKMSLREEIDMLKKTGTYYTRDEAYKILGLEK